VRFFKELKPVIWDEWVIFRRHFFKISISAIINPILYIVAFGLGVTGGTSLSGVSYLKFLLPGVIALTTMNSSYKAISVKLITNRVYDQSFEQFLIAPISIFTLCFGKSLFGAFRGLYSGLLIVVIGKFFNITLNITPGFMAIMFLNGLVFGSLGMLGALIANSHADMNRFGTYVMLPMTFLCGTFFSTNQLPPFLRELVYLMPLTHASAILRSISMYKSFYLGSIFILLAYFILFQTLAYRKCLKIST